MPAAGFCPPQAERGILLCGGVHLPRRHPPRGPHRIGTVVEIWYNPANPEVVERRSLEAELLGALFIAMGFGVIFWLGLR